MNQEIHHKNQIAYTQITKKSRPESLMVTPHRARRRMPSWGARRPTVPGGDTWPSPGCVERAACKRANGERAQTLS
jgi:hypothetical protein